MTLRDRAVIGVRWTSLSALVRGVLQVAQLSILARMLAPSEFGLVVLVSSTLLVLQLLSEAGMSNALIHHRDVSDDQLSSIFWFSLAVGAVLALSVTAASPLIAAWYRKPEIASLLPAASLSLLFNATGQVLRANAQKKLEFGALTAIEFISLAVSFCTSIALAKFGVGAMSVVIGTITAAAVSNALAWRVLSDGWRPCRSFEFDGIRSFLSFGLYSTLNGVVTTLNAQLDVMIGGRSIAAGPMGLYGVSKSLVLNVQVLVNPAVTKVGMPLMAVNHTSKKSVAEIYLSTIGAVSSINFPAYLALFLYAPEISRILLGSAWHDAGDILRLLACWGLIRSVGNPIGALLAAVGQPARELRWNVVCLLVFVPVLVLSAHAGVRALTLALAVLAVLQFFPIWYFLVRPACEATLRQYLAVMGVPLAGALLACLASWAVSRWIDSSPIRLFVGLGIGCAIYAATAWFWNRPVVNLFLKVIGKRA